MERLAVNPKTLPNTLPYGFRQAVAVRGGTRVHLSGQVGVDADERTAGPDLESQIRASFDNIATLLEGQVGGLANVEMLRTGGPDSSDCSAGRVPRDTPARRRALAGPFQSTPEFP